MFQIIELSTLALRLLELYCTAGCWYLFGLAAGEKKKNKTQVSSCARAGGCVCVFVGFGKLCAARAQGVKRKEPIPLQQLGQVRRWVDHLPSDVA